jgi:site-specific DNA-methyltransferase (adenine-specific)
MTTENGQSVAPLHPIVMASVPVRPYYSDSHVTIYNADCLKVLPWVDVGSVVSDPPYGINWRPRVNHIGDDHIWQDDKPFNPSVFLSFGKYHCFWGAQYFADKLPLSESWLCWVKRDMDGNFHNDTRTFSTIELAWTDYAKKPGFKKIVWDGGMRQGDVQNRSFCHPSQKPIELMQWCVGMLPEDCGVVVDPFMGSGTTLVAAKLAGLKCIGIELEEKYCEVAAKRLAQGVLF